MRAPWTWCGGNRQPHPLPVERLDQVATGDPEPLVGGEALEQLLVVLGRQLDVAVELADVGEAVAAAGEAGVEGARGRRQRQPVDPGRLRARAEARRPA